MRCGTSFYNGTLGKRLTTRFWPLIALNAVIWAIALPIAGLSYARSSYGADWATDIEYLFRFMTTPMALVFGVLAAMAVCSHLYSTRSCNFTAALPPKRTALFVTHYLTGLLWLVVPVVVMTLLAVPLAIGYDVSGFFFGLAMVCMQSLFFYSFSVLCGMLTGHLLALPVFYGIFNGLVGGLWFLLTLLFREFYYGYPGSLVAVPDWVEWLTPVWQLYSYGQLADGYPLSAAYAAVGVALTLVSWLLYIKRPMECSGDVVIWAGLRPVFRYSVAICSGLALGSLTRLVLNLGQVGLAVCVILWGVAGCFVGQMFLSKSVRVLRYWKGAAAVVCAFTVLFLVMKFDLTGYETRVPNADEVVSATISGLNSYPRDSAADFQNIQTQDPQSISLITQLHQAVVEQRNTFNGYYEDSTPWTVTYTLSNGTRLTRSYTVCMNKADLSQAGSVTNLASKLVNDLQLMLKSYEFDQLEAAGYQLTGGTFYKVFNGMTYDYSSTGRHNLSAQKTQAIYQAIVQDIEARNLPRTLFYPYDEDGEVFIHVELCWTPSSDLYNDSANEIHVTVAITDFAVNTLKALSQPDI